MENAKFAKMMRDCDLLTAKFTNTDVDIIFTQASGLGSFVLSLQR
jgi:hypothetical protein